jgi:putative transposase
MVQTSGILELQSTVRNPTYNCEYTRGFAMKTLRRYDLRERLYFITVVTYQRERLLLLDAPLFHRAWGQIEPIAWVVMVDHFHAILETGAQSISQIVHAFKVRYSRRFRDKYRPGRVWQNRFWDHVIRNQSDLNHHIDYIHYNPVKHGLLNDPFDYTHSSLSDYYQSGLYERDWGARKELVFEGQYGE